MVTVDSYGQAYFLDYSTKTTLFGPFAVCAKNAPTSVFFPPSANYALAVCNVAPYRLMKFEMAANPKLTQLATFTYIPY